jgi:hypothetical protein
MVLVSALSLLPRCPCLTPCSHYFVDGHNYIWNYASPELMVWQTVWTLGRYSEEGHGRRSHVYGDIRGVGKKMENRGQTPVNILSLLLESR